MSVFYAHETEGSSLYGIILSADSMNHAIPTSKELTSALTKLARCGIVEKVDKRFRISAVYLPALKAAREKRGGHFDTPEKGKKWLCRTKFEINSKARITVTQPQVSKAYAEYRKMSDEILEKLLKKR